MAVPLTLTGSSAVPIRKICAAVVSWPSGGYTNETDSAAAGLAITLNPKRQALIPNRLITRPLAVKNSPFTVSSFAVEPEPASSRQEAESRCLLIDANVRL
jgi:hypothetical protein